VAFLRREIYAPGLTFKLQSKGPLVAVLPSGHRLAERKSIRPQDITNCRSRRSASNTHLIPTSIVEAMANNEILQIVVFAVFFAVAMGAMPERSKPILALIDDLGHLMLKVTGYVMLFAPFAVWAAVMATVAKNGFGVLWKLIVCMGGFYLSLLILWTVLVLVGFHRQNSSDPRRYGLLMFRYSSATHESLRQSRLPLRPGSGRAPRSVL
jgi:L-cystine uptake protein TcyP (sodium:dicarboxylate symporter family)